MRWDTKYQEDGRPSWENYYLSIAVTVSLRGDCRRSQVGAVCVLSDRRTAFFGYNGTPLPGQPGCLAGFCPRGLKTYKELPSTPDYSDCNGVHAERNALKTACDNVGRNRLLDAKMYITREPCWDCQKMMFLDYGLEQALWLPDGSIRYEEFMC